jgi:hypothetical protein
MEEISIQNTHAVYCSETAVNFTNLSVKKTKAIRETGLGG